MAAITFRLPCSLYATIDVASGFQRSMRRSFSSTIRITPSAARRSAYGSLLPVGFSSIAQKPTSMSSFSASATAIATGSVGTLSDGPTGL